jgi:NhaP-type Na+/H+ or K+/H+ antiporter
MGPVAISLIGKGVKPLTSTFMGWFGPRGLASILFVLLITEKSDMPHRKEILVATIMTVMLSILLHGLSAVPAARRYGAAAQKMGDCAENLPVSTEPFSS